MPETKKRDPNRPALHLRQLRNIPRECPRHHKRPERRLDSGRHRDTRQGRVCAESDREYGEKFLDEIY